MINRVEPIPKIQFQRILQQLGGLHDAKVLKILFDIEQHSLTIEIDDMHSNFVGFPNYAGSKPVEIKLLDVNHTFIDFTSKMDEYNINEFSVQLLENDKGLATISFWPQGQISTNFNNVLSTLEELDPA